jgi:N-acetylglutamate synthase-like GNAT family acetyltransferase
MEGTAGRDATGDAPRTRSGPVGGAADEVAIRPAREADQAVIAALIHEAMLNPRHLDWRNFLVAEVGGTIVGLRQVRPHRKGTREVASGYVRPEYRSRGISERLMRELLSREKGPLYLLCNERWTPYYERFGFRRVRGRELPDDMRASFRLGRVVTSVLSLFTAQEIRIVPMARPA